MLNAELTYNGAMDTTHELLIRTITVDGELVAEDRDFAESAQWDWFDEVVKEAQPGEVVQLIDEASDYVLGEEIIGDER